jgi:enoyl-CoA hydratase/carnithine racemase
VTDIGTVEQRLEETPRGRVAWLSLSNPQKLNALSPELIVALHARATNLAEDGGLRAVVLTGAGVRVFAAGADLNVLAKLDEGTARGFITALHEAVDAVRSLPCPVIAMLRGPCLGGAMELAAACDIRVADTTLKAGMPEVRVGIPSVIEACLLPGLVGWGNAADLVLTGDVIDAERALRIGFVQRLVAPEELEAETRRVLESLLSAGAGATRAQKRIIRGWELLPEPEAIEASIAEFAAIYGTPEPGEMMRPFLDRKRKG